jgi:hypothetical protein
MTAEPMEISRGENYEKLKENMNKVKMISQLLWSDCENGVDIIREYFNEQIRFIQISAENKIEQINKLSDELIEFLRKYEKECIQSYLNNNKSYWLLLELHPLRSSLKEKRKTMSSSTNLDFWKCSTRLQNRRSPSPVCAIFVLFFLLHGHLNFSTSFIYSIGNCYKKKKKNKINNNHPSTRRRRPWNSLKLWKKKSFSLGC